ncbi:hypothetical protein ACHAWO_004317 [Cyclotella atomus]|uniref:Uncharacterized protein n=1 Tax=Cyclotella atomus TaxID=382360 RepID=A0ABD3QR47_9STRA
MAFHDLTDGQIAPKAAKSLLGLGSKFITTPKKTTGCIQATSDRFQCDFFIKVYYAGDERRDEVTDDTVQRSKLYVKSKWNPNECDVPNWACRRISRFLACSNELFKERRAKSNLLPHQEALLNSLQTDKGLGRCAITYDQYMEDCLIHLRNTTCYQQLSEAEVMEAVAILEEELKLD